MTHTLAIVESGLFDVVAHQPVAFVDSTQWTADDKRDAAGFGGFLCDLHWSDPAAGAIALSPKPLAKSRYIAAFDREVNSAQEWSQMYARVSADTRCVGVAITDGVHGYDTPEALLARLQRLGRHLWRPLYVFEDLEVSDLAPAQLPSWVFAHVIDMRGLGDDRDAVEAALDAVGA